MEEIDICLYFYILLKIKYLILNISLIWSSAPGTGLQSVISGFVISDENNWFLEKAIVKPCASLAIGETKQIVLPIALCARVKSNQWSYQLWFVEWGKKKKGKTNCVLWNWGKKERAKPIVFCEIGEKKKGQNQWRWRKLSFQLLFVGIGRKKQLQNQVQRCWKKERKLLQQKSCEEKELAF